jgi:hypothetical protein
MPSVVDLRDDAALLPLLPHEWILLYQALSVHPLLLDLVFVYSSGKASTCAVSVDFPERGLTMHGNKDCSLVRLRIRVAWCVFGIAAYMRAVFPEDIGYWYSQE